tara:strand:- start:7051 stop:7758 length:708 start_codon:yes stop_codon:yes gene_type:complete
LTTISIHQPEYLPWIGFFKKIVDSDIFIIYDDVQFEKKDWQNRNVICGKNGTILLSVPVKSHLNSKIHDVIIDNEKNWMQKHLKSILFTYSSTPFFDEMQDLITNVYTKSFEKLVDLNIEIITLLLNKLNITTKIYRSSELKISNNDPNRILSICRKFNAGKYISGTNWAMKNLNKSSFENYSIELELREFVHPVYNQLNPKFTPNISVIDLLFNEGEKKSQEILLSSEIKKIIL